MSSSSPSTPILVPGRGQGSWLEECQEPKRKNSTYCQKRKGTSPNPMSLGLRDSQLARGIHSTASLDGGQAKAHTSRKKIHTSTHSFTQQKLFPKPELWDGSDQEDARLPGTGFPCHPGGLRRYELSGGDPWPPDWLGSFQGSGRRFLFN
ncbi:hypothetical protein LEMLEM_LOCUS25935 [Lemmus lemmus]